MLSNEAVKGAENLALMYSFYQSCKLHGVNFEEYMKSADRYENEYGQN